MTSRFLTAAAAISFMLAATTGLVRAQSLEQMAGQMIVVGFQGDSVTDKSVAALRQQIGDGLLGGVMYLKPNIASLKRVQAMNEAFRAASPDLPPFLTLDQEGGAVERLTKDVGFAELPSAEAIAKGQTPKNAETIYGGMAKAIAGLGFSVNFGPVVDLSINPDNQVIAGYGRAFGRDAKTVVPYAAAFVRAHREQGILTALKHFPGHGSSDDDSHEGFVDITSSWQPEELAPYRDLIRAGLADMVMIGHLYHEAYAKGEGERPATLSTHWIDGVLRGELGFDGVVITDDLEMGAIRSHYGEREAIVTAVRAGVDVLLFTNTAKYSPDLAARVRQILVSEAEGDPAFEARIEESYRRIAALKRRIGD